MSTLLKLDPDLRVELPYGATGATGSYTWSDTYQDGKLVTGASGALVASIPEATKNASPRKAKITFPSGGDFEILGALIGGTEPPTLTIRLFPTFPALAGVIDRGDPIVIRGRPHEYLAGSGYWDLQDIGGAGRPVLLDRATAQSLAQDAAAAAAQAKADQARVAQALADTVQAQALNTLTRNMIVEASAQNAMPSVPVEADLVASTIPANTDTMVRATGEIWRKRPSDSKWLKQAPGLIGPDAVANGLPVGNVDPAVTLLNDMESASGWSNMNNAVFDTARAYTGTQSLRFDAPATTNTAVATARLTLATPMDLSNHAFRFQVYCETAQLANVNNVYVQVFNTSGSVFTAQMSPSFIADDWTSYTVLPAAYVGSAVTPDALTTINRIELGINYFATATPAARVWMDRLEVYEQPEMPMVVVIFDDNNDDTATRAIPYMERYGMRASVPTVTAFMDAGIGAQGLPAYGIDTALQLQGRGHEHTVHTRDHLNLRTIETGGATQGDTEAQMLGGRNDLMRRGLALSGLQHLVYPGGAETRRTYDVARRHFKTARLTGSGNTLVAARGQDMHRLKAMYVVNTTPASAYVTKLQALRKFGGVALLTFHRVLPDGATLPKTEDVTETYFRTIIDAIAAEGLPVVTMDEYVTGGYQRHIAGRWRDRLTGAIRKVSARGGALVTDYVPTTGAGTSPMRPANSALRHDFRPGATAAQVVDLSGNFKPSTVPSGFLWQDGPWRIVANDAAKSVSLDTGRYLGGQAEWSVALALRVTDLSAARVIYREDSSTQANRINISVLANGNIRVQLRDASTGSTNTFDHALVFPANAWVLLVVSVSTANARVNCWLRGGATGKNIYPRGSQSIATESTAATTRTLARATAVEVAVEYSEYLRELTDVEVDGLWSVIKAHFGY